MKYIVNNREEVTEFATYKDLKGYIISNLKGEWTGETPLEAILENKEADLSLLNGLSKNILIGEIAQNGQISYL